MGWVHPWVGLGWVGLGQSFSLILGGLGWAGGDMTFLNSIVLSFSLLQF